LDYSAISPEELVLTCLNEGDESAWTEFVRRFNPLIASVAIRVARRWGEASPQLVDDLIQETYLKLCAERLEVMQNFKSAHKNAIYGYIKVFTANLVHDHCKRSNSLKRGGGFATTSIDGEAPLRSLQSLTSATEVMERELLIQQVDTCLKAVASGPGLERDRRVFWLYYRIGLPASAIAALPSIGLTTKGVESTLLRLTRHVRHRLVSPDRGNPRQDNPREGIQPGESL